MGCCGRWVNSGQLYLGGKGYNVGRKRERVVKEKVWSHKWGRPSRCGWDGRGGRVGRVGGGGDPGLTNLRGNYVQLEKE